MGRPSLLPGCRPFNWRGTLEARPEGGDERRTAMAGALSGISVLEAASFISGPYAAMLLADLGAEVIKVELPGSGDPLRGWGESRGTMQPQVDAYNRGKKSVTINLQSEAGREVYGRLAAEADVVIENFRPGT